MKALKKITELQKNLKENSAHGHLSPQEKEEADRLHKALLRDAKNEQEEKVQTGDAAVDEFVSSQSVFDHIHTSIRTRHFQGIRSHLSHAIGIEECYH